MMISGERTKQLNIFCRFTGFTSDFLSFIDVELIRFFDGAIQLCKNYSVSHNSVESWHRALDVSGNQDDVMLGLGLG